MALKKPVITVGIGLQRPLALSSGTTNNEFKYVAKFSPQLNIGLSYDFALRIGVWANAQVYQEKYGLRFSSEGTIDERNYNGLNVYKLAAGPSVLIGKKLAIRAGVSFHYKVFFLNQATGSYSGNSPSNIIGYQYTWNEGMFQQSVGLGFDGGAVLRIAKRFSIEGRACYYTDRLIPLKGIVEVYYNNGNSRTYIGELDAKQISVGFGLNYRLGKLEGE